MSDYNMMELFPLVIYSVYDKDFVDEEYIKYFHQYRDTFPTEVVSNMGGYQSVSDIHENVDFIPLATRIWEMIEPGCHEITEEFSANGYRGTQLQLDNMWFNINGPGNWNVAHTHPHSFYSGVMWIRAPKDSGDLVFRSPHEHQLYGHRDSMHTIPPETGRIIMFPSHLLHQVTPNKSVEDRYSISFNLNLKVA